MLCTSLLDLFINVAVIWVSMYLIDAFLIFMCSIYVYMFLPINVFMSLLRFLLLSYGNLKSTLYSPKKGYTCI